MLCSVHGTREDSRALYCVCVVTKSVIYRTYNYADSVPNIKFNGAVGIKKLDVWILPLRWRHHSAT